MNAKEDFADLKFRIECSQIVLRQWAVEGLVMRGPGEIWQDEEGLLRYKVFVDQDSYQGLQTYMSKPRVPGQIIPDEDYFTLEAQQHTFPFWTSDRVLPSPRGGLSEGLACGYLDELIHVAESPINQESAFVVLRFRGKLKFPCNQGTEIVVRVGGRDRQKSTAINAAFVEDEGFKFEVLHEREHTVVSVSVQAGLLTPATPSRIHEAFKFVLGQQLALMVVEIQSEARQVTRLTSPARGRGKMLPPLSFRHFDEGGHFWRLFSAYFRHVHQDAQPGWHPTSRHIGSVIESTAASLETEVLTLAVAVEGLVGQSFASLAPVDPDFLRELDSVVAAAELLPLSLKAWARITGSLGAMRSPRNSDVLRSFIGTNNLPAGLYKSWSHLRNASAHGAGSDRNIESIVQSRDEVLSLFYSIVLAVIGYAGPRKDYSLPGWPTQAWPIPPPAAAKPRTGAPPTNSSRGGTAPSG